MAQGGAPAPDVLDWLDEARTRLWMTCLVDLSAAGGPVWREVAAPGSGSGWALLALRDGALVEQARFSARVDGLAALRAAALDAAGHGGQIGVMHGACPGDAARLAGDLRAAADPQRLLLALISPAFGVYLGLHAIAACALPAQA